MQIGLLHLGLSCYVIHIHFITGILIDFTLFISLIWSFEWIHYKRNDYYPT